MLFSLHSCSKSETTSDPSDPVYRDVSGKVQKGPFIKGTSILLNEMGASLNQTGKSFTALIQTDDGGFGLNHISLTSPMALFTANGFYYNEVIGKLSTSQITLQALTKLGESSTVNINILTHLIKDRITILMMTGKTFEEAKSQAQQELLGFFGIELTGDLSFETADISENTELNAALLAISVVTQRNTASSSGQSTLVAELTQLLANMSSDFMIDGEITSQTIVDTLLYNISVANLVSVRNNMVKRYAEIGFTVSVPDFEKYVSMIQKHLTPNAVTHIIYPDKASPYFIFQNDSTSWVANLLNTNTFNFGLQRDYSIAAIVPFDTTLTVKFFFSSNFSVITPDFHGWELVYRTGTEMAIRSTLFNSILVMPLGATQPGGTARIEFYRNEETSPCRVKNISFH
jgi:hypothetical protein